MPTFTVLATDNFNRSDSTDLGSNWDAGYTGYDNCIVDQLFCTAEAANTTAMETYNAITWPDNQYVEFQLVTWMNENLAYAVLRAASPATATFYYIGTSEFGGATFTNEIGKVIAGSSTTLADESVSAWSTNDVVKGAVLNSDLYLYQDGVQVLTATDSAIASGRGGVQLLYFLGGAGGDVNIDNWSGGEVTGDAVVVTPHHFLLLGVGR